MKRWFLGYSKKKPADSRTIRKSTRAKSIDTLQAASIDSVNQKSIDNVHHLSIATRKTTVIDRANQPSENTVHPNTVHPNTVHRGTIHPGTVHQELFFLILVISRRSTLFILRRWTLFIWTIFTTTLFTAILFIRILFIVTLFIRWKTTPLAGRQKGSKCLYLRSMRMGC